jgi:hypothetical protein
MAMAAMIAAGVASSGALGAFLTRALRSRTEVEIRVIQAELKEMNHHGKQCN